MRTQFTALALVAGLALTVSASAQSSVSTFSKVKLYVAAEQAKTGKPAEIEGTLNLDPDSRNVLFVANERVQKTIPYRSISALQFFMANHLLRILYTSRGVEQYIDLALPGAHQPDLLKQIQEQTGIAIRLS